MSKKEKLVKVTAAKTFQCMGPKGVMSVKAGDTIEISEDEADSALHAGLLTESPKPLEGEGLTEELAEVKTFLAEARSEIEAAKELVADGRGEIESVKSQLTEAQSESENLVSDLKSATSEIESLKEDLKKANEKPAAASKKSGQKA